MELSYFNFSNSKYTKSFQSIYHKAKKHNAIKLLVQSKLNGKANIISQAMQDRDISSIEFHKVLQEVEKSHRLRADIRKQANTKIKQITKEQREELLEQEWKEGKDHVWREIESISSIHGGNAI